MDKENIIEFLKSIIVMADSAGNKEKAIWVIKHACKNKLEEIEESR